jgi:hypothetical protein
MKESSGRVIVLGVKWTGQRRQVFTQVALLAEGLKEDVFARISGQTTPLVAGGGSLQRRSIVVDHNGLFIPGPALPKLSWTTGSRSDYEGVHGLFHNSPLFVSPVTPSRCSIHGSIRVMHDTDR